MVKSDYLHSAVKFVIALAIISGFIIVSVIPNHHGVWYYDSAIYWQQGFDINAGRPPVYPIFIKAVGRNVVHYQIGLAILSWCFLGYTLAGFPGLLLGGFFSISPWFCRWNGLCLSESISHSFAALVIGFSILMIQKSKWFILWFISLLLFAFTRFANVFILPFCAWPAIFCWGKMKYFIIAGIIAIIIPAFLMVGRVKKVSPNKQGDVFSSLIPLKTFSTHRLALLYLLDGKSRPYFLGSPMTDDYAGYMPRLSHLSNSLTWMKLPKYAYPWILLIFIPILEIIIRKKLSMYSVLIISLFLAGYTQCLINIIWDNITQTKSEIWRHLAISDCFYVFSIIAAIGLLRQLFYNKFLHSADKNYNKISGKSISGKRKKVTILSRLLSWCLILVAIFIFVIMIIPIYHLKPLHPYWPDGPPVEIREVIQYLKNTESQIINGLETVIFSKYKASRGCWNNKSILTSWVYSNTLKKGLAWESALCPQRKITTVVFSGVLSKAQGTFQLFVNNKAVLTFNSNPESRTVNWGNNNFNLAFYTIKANPKGPKFGIFCLTVPEEEITAGTPIMLKVTGGEIAKSGEGYFMLNQVTDTLGFLEEVF